MKTNAIPTKESKIARTLVKRVTRTHMSRQQAKVNGERVVTSLGTARNYRYWVKGFLTWLQDNRVPLDGKFLPEHMQEYLCDRADLQYKQQYLDSIFQALQTTFNVKLVRVESEVPLVLKSRAYAAQEVESIVRHQQPRNSLATKIAFSTGLRAHEFFTLRRLSEQAPSSHREWRADLFKGFEAHTIYTVTGKGGLKRCVAIPLELSKELELRRLTNPVEVKDREITYLSFYDIGGGQAFSQSVSDASSRSLSSSNGAHGLRHSYAQRRLVSLRASGTSVSDCLLILSQELGHFRPDICLAYLR